MFFSYTSADSEWAHWIGYILQENGYTPFVHEWEIPAGGNIPGWMEKRLEEADRVIAIISPKYLENKEYSLSERLAAYWENPTGDPPFLIPIVVSETDKLPRLIGSLKRVHLHGKVENHAAEELIDFLKDPSAPEVRPIFPGGAA